MKASRGLATLLLVIAVASCRAQPHRSEVRHPRPTMPSTTSTDVHSDPGIVGVAVAKDVFYATSADGVVYATDHDNPVLGLYRLDGSGAVTAHADGSFAPMAPAVGAGSVWAVRPARNDDRAMLLRLDPTSLATTESAPIEIGLADAIAATGDAVWIATDDVVIRVDPATLRTVASIAVPPHPWAIAVEGPDVVVSCMGANGANRALLVIDTAGNRIRRTIPTRDLGDLPARDGLLRSLRNDGALVQVTARTGAVSILPLQPVQNATDFLIDGDDVWVSDFEDHVVVRESLSSGRVQQMIAKDPRLRSPQILLKVENEVWALNQSSGRFTRLVRR